jgi:dATP pyrophosphohydrolase
MRGVAVVAIRETTRDHEVLLLRRTQINAGEWCQIAGKIEPGETAWQAALREMREETGLVPSRLYSADLCEQFYEVGRDSIWLAPIFVAFVEPEVTVTLNEEHSEHCWTSIDRAIDLLPFPGQKTMLVHTRHWFVEREPSRLLEIEINGVPQAT